MRTNRQIAETRAGFWGRGPQNNRVFFKELYNSNIMTKKFSKTRGAVSAGHELTAEAGAEMLRAGGNAFDAAVAASFASFIADGVITSIGAGGFALVHNGDTKENQLYDFFVNMPGLGKVWEKENLDFQSVDIDFGTAIQEFHIGKGSVAVPGNVKGLCEIHNRFGRLPFKEVLTPAIDYCKNGIEVTPLQHSFMKVLHPIPLYSESVQKIYGPKGNYLDVGQTMYNPELGDLLDSLGKEGPRLFYEGEAAKMMVNFLSDGGLLTLEDLKTYQVIVREPLAINYRDDYILTNPPPSSGGSLIAHSLNLLSQHNFNGLDFNDADFLKIFIAVMEATNKSYNKSGQKKDTKSNTTHISTIDEEWNAVSMTTSHGEGCGYAVAGLGIHLNNMLGEEDINPKGFHAEKPGARLTSMIAPTMALKNGRPHVVLGSGGSNRLRTAILQTLVKLIDFKMSIDRAVNSSRVHWENGKLNAERGIGEQTLKKIEEAGFPVNTWQLKNFFFGGVHAVCRDIRLDNPFTGAGDIRRGGIVKEV